MKKGYDFRVGDKLAITFEEPCDGFQDFNIIRTVESYISSVKITIGKRNQVICDITLEDYDGLPNTVIYIPILKSWMFCYKVRKVRINGKLIYEKRL